MSLDGRAQAWAWTLALIGVVVALDQSTKQIALSSIERTNPIELPLGFQLANVRNKGIAFGLFAGGKAALLALTLGAVALLLLYFTFNASRPGLWAAVGLVTGGALGNLADRTRAGAVTDFIDPPLWPAFNVADVAIVAGVVLLVLVLMTPAGKRAGAS